MWTLCEKVSLIVSAAQCVNVIQLFSSDIDLVSVFRSSPCGHRRTICCFWSLSLL